MRTTIFVITILTIALTGCSASRTAAVITATPAQTVSSDAKTGSLFAINEVGLGPNGYIALTNFTDQTANLGGLFLCQGTKCFELPKVGVIPGKTVRIAVGDGTGLNDVVATKATIGVLRPSDGEIALYASKNRNDPKAILLYLEWGSTPHDDTQVAIDSGLWLKGAFAPSSNSATRIYRNEGGLWLFDTK